jgi:cbb3-type cytochrome oxidase maturation protein
MIIIFLLIPVSIVAAAIFLTAFIWAVRSGQYDDTCTPAMRLLSEETVATKKPPAKPSEQKLPIQGQ